MKRLLYILPLLACSAFAQVYSSGGPIVNNVGQPVPGNLAICTTSPTITLHPPDCAVYAATYTDVTLSVPCTLSPVTLGPLNGTGCTNPGKSDSRGNIIFYETPAAVFGEIYGYGITTYIQPMSSVGPGNFVSGPVSSITNDLVSFADTTGKVVADSGILSTNVATGIANFISPNILIGTGSGRGITDSGISSVSPTFSGVGGYNGTGITNGTIFNVIGNSLTSGNGIVDQSSNITNGNIFLGYHSTSTFIGNGIALNFAAGSGSFTGNFENFINNSVSKYSVDASGNTVQSGNATIGSGSNIVYRCSVAGADRAGVLTTVSADCGTAVDTGLRVK